jgi:hypothetical protein
MNDATSFNLETPDSSVAENPSSFQAQQFPVLLELCIDVGDSAS